METFEMLVSVGKSLLSEMDTHQNKNAELCETIKNNFNYIKKLREREVEQVKNDIQALINAEENLGVSPGRKAKVGELSKQEQQLQQEYVAVKQNLDELSAQCQKLESLKDQLKGEHSKLVDDKDRLENETTIMLPMRREEIRLYTSISHIRWDFDSSKDEMKGYITNKNEVTPFCFDKRKCSQFFITNALWDSMKED